MKNDIECVLITEEELREKVAAMGAQISRDFAGKDPLFVGVLKGCFVFMADLMRYVDLPCSVDFMAVSSYSGVTSTGAASGEAMPRSLRNASSATRAECPAGFFAQASKSPRAGGVLNFRMSPHQDSSLSM